MNEEELIAFIEHIRKMCQGDGFGFRILSSLGTLHSILERQQVDRKYLDLLHSLAIDEAADLLYKSDRIASMEDLERIIEEGEKLYRIRLDCDAHSGC